MRFLRTNGIDSLVWPFEGSGLLLYCPAVFVLLGLVGLCVQPTLDVAYRRRIIALVALAISLFVETLILNNAFSPAALGVADNGTRGILRGHLNLLPYLLLLIGVLGCAKRDGSNRYDASTPAHDRGRFHGRRIRRHRCAGARHTPDVVREAACGAADPLRFQAQPCSGFPGRGIRSSCWWGSTLWQPCCCCS